MLNLRTRALHGMEQDESIIPRDDLWRSVPCGTGVYIEIFCPMEWHKYEKFCLMRWDNYKNFVLLVGWNNFEDLSAS